jgi:molybdopterin converting factor small subunit
MSSVKIQLFGAFRRHGDDAVFHLPLEAPCSLSVLRELLASHFDAELLHESAFGTEEAILSDDAMIAPGQTIAVLPPVCGG